MNGFWSTASLVALAAGLSAQEPAKPAQTPAQPPAATFKVQVDLVTNDIIVRDEKGNFIPDLKKDEFEIFEDGVKQDITSMTVVTGGRVTNVLAPPPPPPPEGIVLPPSRPRTDVSGRIFLFFVDDLHLQFHNTGRVRDLFKKHLEGAGPRGRHVRHRLERSLVDRRGHDLRQDAAGRGDQEDGRQRAEAVRHHPGTVGRGRPERSPLSRARRVLDGQRSAQQPRLGAQPPQGADLRERRLRLQAVPGRAARVDGSELAVRAERIRAQPEPGAGGQRRRFRVRRPIRSRSSRSRARRSPTPIWRASSAS